MGTEVSTEVTFEDKLKEKLRKDIGDLMPDSALEKLVEEGIRNVFFCKRKKQNGYNGSIDVPSWFEQEIAKLLKDKMNVCVNDYMAKNADQMTKIAGEAMATAGPEIMASLFMGLLKNNGYGFEGFVQNMMIERLKNAGIINRE